MFDVRFDMLGLAVAIAGFSGLLLGALLVFRRLSGDPDASTFRATDHPGPLERVARTGAAALPWILGLVVAGSLAWAAAIALGFVPA